MAPFHRSWLFWLGLPALLFLGWLWWIAPPRMLKIGGGSYLQTLAYSDALEIVVVDSPSPFRWRTQTGKAHESDRAHPFKPVFKVQRMKFHSTRYTYLSMRPWLPIAAYVTLWLGALALWLRRKSRRMAAAIRA